MDTSQYCRENYADRISINGQIIQGEWRRNENIHNLQNVTSCGSNNYTKHAGQIRNTFADYFTNEGQLSWQEGYIT